MSLRSLLSRSAPARSRGRRNRGLLRCSARRLHFVSHARKRVGAMDVVFLIGRILFGVLFVYSGFGHFAAREAMQGYARQAGAPAPAVTVPLTGAVIIVSGLAVILGVLPDLAALLIAGFLLLTAFIIHAFWRVEDPQIAPDGADPVQQGPCARWRGARDVLRLEPAPGRRRPIHHRPAVRARRLSRAAAGAPARDARATGPGRGSYEARTILLRVAVAGTRTACGLSWNM
jgi:uncharacterized membrane protein YphA (DoxX/SURF4 family)